MNRARRIRVYRALAIAAGALVLPPPTESAWAQLREAQRLAVKDDAHAGLTVAIDIGGLYDIHPANFGIQEWMHHAEETDDVFPHDYFFRDGRLHCGEAPGHGVTIDEQLAARFPYSPKQLPIARLEDGSMWDW